MKRSRFTEQRLPLLYSGLSSGPTAAWGIKPRPVISGGSAPSSFTRIGAQVALQQGPILRAGKQNIPRPHRKEDEIFSLRMV
jgi:hypothetical protein